jgi:hypothetical protein
MKRPYRPSRGGSDLERSATSRRLDDAADWRSLVGRMHLGRDPAGAVAHAARLDVGGCRGTIVAH